MKRIILALAAAFCSLSLGAVPLSVSGRVSNDKGEALQGVKVTDGYSFVRTDSLGAYTLDVHPDAAFVYLYTHVLPCQSQAARQLHNAYPCGLHMFADIVFFLLFCFHDVKC